MKEYTCTVSMGLCREFFSQKIIENDFDRLFSRIEKMRRLSSAERSIMDLDALKSILNVAVSHSAHSFEFSRKSGSSRQYVEITFTKKKSLDDFVRECKKYNFL